MKELFDIPFNKPEYFHILLNPVPTHVLPLGVLILAAALYFRSHGAIVAGLFLILVSSAAAFPVYEFGEKAYDRIAARTDDDGQSWLDEHSHRAEKIVPVFYVEALVAAASLAALRRKSVSATYLVGGSLVLGTLLIAAGGWVAFAGGKVSHHEFRVSPPPVAATNELGALSQPRS